MAGTSPLVTFAPVSPAPGSFQVVGHPTWGLGCCLRGADARGVSWKGHVGQGQAFTHGPLRKPPRAVTHPPWALGHMGGEG